MNAQQKITLFTLADIFQELQRVMDLQESLHTASSICDRGRRFVDSRGFEINKRVV